jgi:hypothetical protein
MVKRQDVSGEICVLIGEQEVDKENNLLSEMINIEHRNKKKKRGEKGLLLVQKQAAGTRCVIHRLTGTDRN